MRLHHIRMSIIDIPLQTSLQFFAFCLWSITLLRCRRFLALRVNVLEFLLDLQCSLSLTSTVMHDIMEAC